MADRLQEIKDRLAAATPGPWRWGGYANSTGLVYLSTVNHGRVMVMTFERLGMQGAAPVFWQHSPEEVRKGWGGRQARIRESAVREVPYRDDIDHIDNPDAQLIADAPELLAWAVAEIERRDAVIEAARAVRDLSCENTPLPCDGCDWCRLRAALAALDAQPLKEAV